MPRSETQAFLVEVLTAYSHTPARLDDLQKTWQVVHSQWPGEPEEGRNEAASRPRACGRRQTDCPGTRCRRSSTYTGEA
jgi:hypothetical protein